MNIEYVKQVVANIRVLNDDERAHSSEDELRAKFIAFVAKTGPAELAELAREVLKTDELSFSRWRA